MNKTNLNVVSTNKMKYILHGTKTNACMFFTKSIFIGINDKVHELPHGNSKTKQTEFCRDFESATYLNFCFCCIDIYSKFVNNLMMSIIFNYLIFTSLILQNESNVLSSAVEVSKRKDNTLDLKYTTEHPQKKGHVLFFHHAGTTSHINVLKALAIGLLDNGHKVTTSFYGKTNIIHENYTEISIKDG